MKTAIICGAVVLAACLWATIWGADADFIDPRFR